jgi:hypothetical protein
MSWRQDLCPRHPPMSYVLKTGPVSKTSSYVLCRTCVQDILLCPMSLRQDLCPRHPPMSYVLKTGPVSKTSSYVLCRTCVQDILLCPMSWRQDLCPRHPPMSYVLCLGDRTCVQDNLLCPMSWRQDLCYRSCKPKGGYRSSSPCYHAQKKREKKQKTYVFEDIEAVAEVVTPAQILLRLLRLGFRV